MTLKSEMKVHKRLIAEMLSDPKNAREHPEPNLKAVEDSLRQFGQVEPIVVNKRTGFIVGGHGRIDAMKRLGWTEVECVYVDLDEPQATALSLLLNRTSELGAWNELQLVENLKLVQEWDPAVVLGWDAEQMTALMEPPVPPVPPEAFPSVDGALHTEYTCPKCTYSWSGKPR